MSTKSRVTRLIVLALAALPYAMPAAARACDQCMGGKDPNIRPAVNGAIFFMLGMVALMATGVGLFMRYLAKRANSPMPPHIELVQMMTMPESPNHV